jgi:hypothetical protein
VAAEQSRTGSRLRSASPTPSSPPTTLRCPSRCGRPRPRRTPRRRRSRARTTFLNVRGADAVVEAVRRCCRSSAPALVFTERNAGSGRPTWTSRWSSSAN